MKGAFSMPNKQAHNYVITAVDFSQPLKDISTTGKERPWAEHRGSAELLAWAYEGLRPEKAARLRTCAPRLLYEVRRDEDGHTKNEAAHGMVLPCALVPRVSMAAVS